MNYPALLKVESLAAYDAIAGEYYDAERHPTCASLRELSSAYLVPKLANLPNDGLRLVEVGAGKSIAAPVWASMGRELESVTLIDSSEEMLSYSTSWGQLGAHLSVAEATATKLPSGSVDILVSSLGDPYNTVAFWREAARILRPGGMCHFTAPAYEWAAKFRPGEFISVAEFVRNDGAVLLLPSPAIKEQEQMEFFSDSCLELIDARSLTLCDLSSEPAPKLLCMAPDEPVVRGYSVRR